MPFWGFFDSSDLNFCPWQAKKDVFVRISASSFEVVASESKNIYKFWRKMGLKIARNWCHWWQLRSWNRRIYTIRTQSKHTSICNNVPCITRTHYNACRCLHLTLWAQKSMFWSKYVLMNTHLDHHQGVTNFDFLVPHFSSDLDVSRQEEACQKSLAEKYWKLAT